jgi:hypothetical protein
VSDSFSVTSSPTLGCWSDFALFWYYNRLDSAGPGSHQCFHCNICPALSGLWEATLSQRKWTLDNPVERNDRLLEQLRLERTFTLLAVDTLVDREWLWTRPTGGVAGNCWCERMLIAVNWVTSRRSAGPSLRCCGQPESSARVQLHGTIVYTTDSSVSAGSRTPSSPSFPSSRAGAGEVLDVTLQCHDCMQMSGAYVQPLYVR